MTEASARVKELFVGKAVDAVTIAASLLAERFLLPNGWCNLEYKPKGDYFVTKVGGRRVHLTDNEMSLFVSEACKRHGRCWCGTVEVYRTLAWMCYRGVDRDWIDPYSGARPSAAGAGTDARTDARTAAGLEIDASGNISGDPQHEPDCHEPECDVLGRSTQ
jgi:hypothetical protein